MKKEELVLGRLYGWMDSLPSQHNIRKGLFKLMAVTLDGRALIDNGPYGEKFVGLGELISKEEWRPLYEKWKAADTALKKKDREYHARLLAREKAAEARERARDRARRAAERERNRLRAERKRAKRAIRLNFSKKVQEEIAVLEDALLERLPGVTLSAVNYKTKLDEAAIRVKIILPLKSCMERLLPLFRRSTYK